RPHTRAGVYSSPCQQLPTVDDDGLAGDPAGERRRKEEDDVGDLLRPAEPAERYAAEDAVVELRVLGLALLPGTARKLDRAGRDAIDADILAREKQRLACRVVDERRLDRRVGRGARRGAKARDRGDIDDRPAA